MHQQHSGRFCFLKKKNECVVDTQLEYQHAGASKAEKQWPVTLKSC